MADSDALCRRFWPGGTHDLGDGRWQYHLHDCRESLNHPGNCRCWCGETRTAKPGSDHG